MSILRRWLLGIFGSCLLLCTGTSAQETLTNDSIIKMVKADLSESVIVTMVRQHPGNYSTKVDDLIALKEAGVSDEVVGSMVAKMANPSGAASTPSSEPPEARDGSAMEIGIYAKAEGVWIPLETELVNIKQASVFRVYTGGVNTNGFIKRSK
jgi:hypothetical protein